MRRSGQNQGTKASGRGSILCDMEDRGVCESVVLVERGAYGCRVNAAPLCSEEIKVRTYPIEKTSNERVQESLVVRDLLLVLQGYEGVYIRYNNSYRREALVGPEYKVVKMMNVTFKSFSKKLIKVGSTFIRLDKFQQWCMEEKYGRLMHRLGHEVRQFLYEDYLGCIKELEKRFMQDTRFSIRDVEMVLEERYIYKFRLLDELVTRVLEELQRRSDMDRIQMDFQNFMEDLRQDNEEDIRVLYDTRVSLHVKGGVLLSILAEMIGQQQGDMRHLSCLEKIYHSLMSAYGCMFEEWMVHGNLADEHGEFLICDTLSDTRRVGGERGVDNGVVNQDTERLWETRYVIRKDGLLPQFRDKDIQYKILMAGKLWNVVKTCCGENFSPHHREDRKDLHDILNGTNLKTFVNKWYDRANTECYQLFHTGYCIEGFLQTIHNQFMFHGNWNRLFKQAFLFKTLVDLTRSPPTENSRSRLQRHLDDIDLQGCSSGGTPHQYDKWLLKLTSVRIDSVTFFESLKQFVDEPVDINNNVFQADNFQQLRTLLLDESRVTTPVDKHNTKSPTILYLQLETTIPYPLNIIWTRPVMVQYQMVQRLLMILMYHQRLLEDTWFEISKPNSGWMAHARSQPDQTPAGLAHVVRITRVIHFQMRSHLTAVTSHVTRICQLQNRSLAQWLAAASRGGRRPGAVAMDMSMATANVNVLQQRIQDHVTNIMSLTGLTNAAAMASHERTLHMVHAFIRYIASWRRKQSSPGAPGQGPHTETSSRDVWAHRRRTVARFHQSWSALMAQSPAPGTPATPGPPGPPGPPGAPAGPATSSARG